jgi:hypothetical protein
VRCCVWRPSLRPPAGCTGALHCGRCDVTTHRATPTPGRCCSLPPACSNTAALVRCRLPMHQEQGPPADGGGINCDNCAQRQGLHGCECVHRLKALLYGCAKSHKLRAHMLALVATTLLLWVGGCACRWVAPVAMWVHSELLSGCVAQQSGWRS